MVQVPIWVKFRKLDLGCWRSRGTSKVASLLGRSLMANKYTQETKMLSYARVLIEIDIAHDIPETIQYVDEQGGIVAQAMECERKPLRCSKCKMFGHLEVECRKGIKRVWVSKQVNKEVEAREDNGVEKEHEDIITESAQGIDQVAQVPAQRQGMMLETNNTFGKACRKESLTTHQL